MTEFDRSNHLNNLVQGKTEFTSKMFPIVEDHELAVFHASIFNNPEFYDEEGNVSVELIQERFPVRYEIYRHLQMHNDGEAKLLASDFALIKNALLKLNGLRMYSEHMQQQLDAGHLEDIRSVKQVPIYQAISDFIEQGYTHGKIESATGSGKTEIFMNTIFEGNFPTAAILVPTISLGEQTERRVIANMRYREKTNLTVGMINSNRKEYTADLRVIPYPSFVNDSRSSKPKIRTNNTAIIIVDEAHHSATEIRLAALNRLNPFVGKTEEELSQIPEYSDTTLRALRFISGTDSIVISFTATGYGIGEYLGPLIHKIPLREAIEEGMLSGVRVNFAVVNFDISNFRMEHGEFSTEQIERIIRENKIFDSVAEVYKKEFYRNDQDYEQAICFWNTQQQADAAAEVCRQHGIHSFSTHSGKEKEEQETIDRLFKSGKLHILHDVKTKTEGYDYPELSVCLVPLPRFSATRLEQEMGRVTRLKKDRRSATIVNWIYKDTRSRQVTAADILGGAVVEQSQVEQEKNPETFNDKTGIKTLPDIEGIVLLTNVEEVALYLSKRPHWTDEDVSTRELATMMGVSTAYFANISDKGQQIIEAAIQSVEAQGYERDTLRIRGRFKRILAEEIKRIYDIRQSYVPLGKIGPLFGLSAAYFQKNGQESFAEGILTQAIANLESRGIKREILITSDGAAPVLVEELGAVLRLKNQYSSRANFSQKLREPDHYFDRNNIGSTGARLLDTAVSKLTNDGLSKSDLFDSHGNLSPVLQDTIQALHTEEKTYVLKSEFARRLELSKSYFTTNGRQGIKQLQRAIAELVEQGEDEKVLINAQGKLSLKLQERLEQIVKRDRSFVPKAVLGRQLGKNEHYIRHKGYLGYKIFIDALAYLTSQGISEDQLVNENSELSPELVAEITKRHNELENKS